MGELLLRAVIGGVVVSFFSILGDLLKPKSFAGLFGSAPSIALASIALAVIQNGRAYAAVEAHFMILGGLAFLVYASAVSRLLMRRKMSALPVTGALLILWLGLALGLWYVVQRHGS